MIKLLVGLGNPGKKYTKTRHNAGFLLLDELAKEGGVAFSRQARFFGDLAELNSGSGAVYLLKPVTFMNRSGQSVAAIMKYYKIKAEEILVVHDELDFSVGVLRLKAGGGHGGHNGLRDIIASIGTNEFKRLRVGIGRPSSGKVVVDYVLSDFSKSDLLQIRALILHFIGHVPLLLAGDFALLTRKLHAPQNN